MDYGPRPTVFNRLNRWSQRGIWQGLLAALAAGDDPPEVAMIDSTAVNPHRSAAGAKAGSKARPSAVPAAARRPRSNALADGDGRLYALMLKAGQVHDIHGGRALLDSVPPIRRLIADMAYDANDLRGFLAAQGTLVVISPMPERRAPPAFDRLA